MAELVSPSAAGRSYGKTQRQDSWWVEIVPVVVLLGGFGIYATLRAFEGRFYEWGPYLSPLYSPLIDRPNLGPAWGAKNNIIEREGDAMRLRQEKVPEMPEDLRSMLADQKGEAARRA